MKFAFFNDIITFEWMYSVLKWAFGIVSKYVCEVFKMSCEYDYFPLYSMCIAYFYKIAWSTHQLVMVNVNEHNKKVAEK